MVEFYLLDLLEARILSILIYWSNNEIYFESKNLINIHWNPILTLYFVNIRSDMTWL